MALGTNYKRTPSGIYDDATCYKMAVVGGDEDKAAKFLKAVQDFPHASDAVRRRVLRDMENFKRTYRRLG
jgi:hypothetical protein